WSPSLLPRHFLAPSVSFFLTHTPTTEIYPLSLHDALPIWPPRPAAPAPLPGAAASARRRRLGHPPPPRGRPAVVQVNLVQRGLGLGGLSRPQPGLEGQFHHGHIVFALPRVQPGHRGDDGRRQ